MQLNIISGAEIENDWYQLSIADALLAGWRVVETDRQPNYLAVLHVLARTQMLVDHLEDRLGAELPNTLATDARKVLGDAVRKRVFQAFFAHWAIALADVVWFRIHRRPSRAPFFFALTEPNESSSLR